MATLSSIADAETFVRSLVDRDLAALPPSFGDPANYRPTIVRFYCDQVAQQVAAGVFSGAAADIGVVAQAEVARMLREELLRRTM